VPLRKKKNDFFLKATKAQHCGRLKLRQLNKEKKDHIIVVSRVSGNAVQRNRFKRIFRQRLPDVKESGPLCLRFPKEKKLPLRQSAQYWEKEINFLARVKYD